MMYDAIIVGPMRRLTTASPARAGQRVLLVDRAGFPSDRCRLTPSNRRVLPVGPLGSARRRARVGAPFLDVVRFDAGDVVIEGSRGRSTHNIARRSASLVVRRPSRRRRCRGWRGSTARLRRERLLVEDGRVVGIGGRDAAGRYVEERARIVIGADGRARSLPAC